MSQDNMSEKKEKLQEHSTSGPKVREHAAKQFLNLSALAVREKAITLFLLITIVAAGACTITASQPGNTSFLAAVAPGEHGWQVADRKGLR